MKIKNNNRGILLKKLISFPHEILQQKTQPLGLRGWVFTFKLFKNILLRILMLDVKKKPSSFATDLGDIMAHKSL